LTVLVVPGCGNGGKTREAAEELPIRDDFQGECAWPQEISANDEVSCAEGHYKILIKTANSSSWVPRRTKRGYRSVSVSAEATQLDPPSSDGSTLQGVGCWASARGEPILGYILGLYALGDGTGGYLIARHNESDEQLKQTLYIDPLVDKESDALPALGSPAKVRGECRKTENSVELALYVDGVKVAAATDTHDAAAINAFVAYGFYAFTTTPEIDFRYDDFVVEEITG
jgi:hypothetical protein